MAKDKVAYVCSNCGQESPKWIGKCPACGQWNTFKEIRIASEAPRQAASSAAATIGHALRKNRALRLAEIDGHDDPRIDMNDAELNRVLGGGLVPGSIVLLGGEPGIGKSTLSLQTMRHLTDKRILYISGEESAHQLKMRAERLNPISPENLLILCENSLENIFEHIRDEQPELVVIDSIQTIATEEIESSAGSVRHSYYASPRPVGCPSSSLAISPRKAHWPVLRFWSTLSIPSYSSKATSITCTAYCEA